MGWTWRRVGSAATFVVAALGGVAGNQLTNSFTPALLAFIILLVLGTGLTFVTTDSHRPPPPDRDYRRTDLRFHDFSNADLYGLDFSGADLTGASFKNRRPCETEIPWGRFNEDELQGR
jgi:uncharacterized protein YjbI with pentapeptide repeats